MDVVKASVSIENNGNYLIAKMPNGEIIPMQMGCRILEHVEKMGFVKLEVTLTSYIPIADFEIIKKFI